MCNCEFEAWDVPESNDLNVGCQAGQQDSEAWALPSLPYQVSDMPSDGDVHPTIDAIANVRDALERRK